MDNLKGYLEIEGKKIHIAKSGSAGNIYIALPDLIDCSLNQKNSKIILSLCIKKYDVKIFFADENNLYISKRAAIAILKKFPSHITPHIIDKITACKKIFWRDRFHE